MSHVNVLDSVLIHWGDRLFYPSNRRVSSESPRLHGGTAQLRARRIRERIAATARRAPQVMVKVTGGGRGMKAIAAHLRYISKNGRLEIEDELGRVTSGKESLRDLAEEWRWSGSAIPDASDRREAFNIMLSMPRGSADASTIQRAVREFAASELQGHKYVMVLHDHQAHPHVHISVRAEGRDGRRLNPRKSDLHRWRETFAEKLRGWGIDAEATRQATRGTARNYPRLWQQQAAAEWRLRRSLPATKAGAASASSRAQAAEAWARLAQALGTSQESSDRLLAERCRGLLAAWPGRTIAQRAARRPEKEPASQMQSRNDLDRGR